MRVLAMVVAVVLVGCQTYDFERVQPFTIGQTTESHVIASRRLKPNVMLLVDNSGSMLLPTDSAVPTCTSGGVLCSGASCPPSCPTRISELKTAMSGFLASSGTAARLGLTVFPTPNGSANGLLGCDASSNVVVQLPSPTPDDEASEASLGATAGQIAAAIGGLSPIGGTPTAGSLQFLSSYGGLSQEDYRDDFVLLMTDGLPNCNGNNPNAVCTGAVQTCECTTTSCGGSDAARGTCSKGCLDRDATVEQVKSLRARGIRTIVVGFGADVATGTAPAVLDAMAREGGFPRGCPTGEICLHTYFQARDAAELTVAFKEITGGLINVCDYVLTARPTEPNLLAVLIDGQTVLPGATTYDYDFAANKVTFLGPVCDRLKTSTPQHPVGVEFRIVERF